MTSLVNGLTSLGPCNWCRATQPAAATTHSAGRPAEQQLAGGDIRDRPPAGLIGTAAGDRRDRVDDSSYQREVFGGRAETVTEVELCRARRS